MGCSRWTMNCMLCHAASYVNPAKHKGVRGRRNMLCHMGCACMMATAGRKRALGGKTPEQLGRDSSMSLEWSLLEHQPVGQLA